MTSNWVHKVSELAPEDRVLVKRWVGRRLSDDETVSLHVYQPHPASVDADRENLGREILSQAREIGSRAEMSDEEADALIDNAFADIRRKRA